MSPRRSSSTAVNFEVQQDVVMDPVILPTSFVTSTSDKELVQKYRSLKRRYDELGEETGSESQRSEERNVKMREERSTLLESIVSLEKEHPGIQVATLSESSSPQPGSGSTPPGSSNGSSANTYNLTRNDLIRDKGETASRIGNGSPNLVNGALSSSQGNNLSPLQPVGAHSEMQSSGRLPDSQPTNGATIASSTTSPSSSRPQPQQPPIASSSRAPASGPARTTRRSGRMVSMDQTQVQDGGDKTSPKIRAKRVTSSPTAKARLTRSDTAALAAAAVKAAEAETSNLNSTQFAHAATSNTSPHQMAASSSSLNPPISGETASDPNIDPSLVNTESNGINQPQANEPSPMDNIVKVAEAAIAAQLAANSSQTPSSAPSTSASPAPSQTPTTSTNATSSSSSKSYNPYMIATQMTPSKLDTSSMSPLSMNPYAMYYGPGTPITPATSPYSPYANPYYYLTTPMAGPSGIYPPNANFPQPNTPSALPKNQPQAKPKRLKAHTVTSKSFSIPMVPRDKRGKPMLPLNVGIMTVISLGDVCMREHFHTERYIFPVGYEVTRRYLSTIDLNHEVVYHCTILDGGDGPKFQIVPSDVPDRPVIAGTATGAWSSIVKQANAIRNRQHSNSVSGPDFFGLGQNTIKHLIQELPNADRLKDYVWQTFIEGGPLGGRHAAVIPALPEEYDASMPIGAYYPTERDKRKREAAAGTVDTPAPKGISHYPQHIIAQAEAQRVQQQALQQAQQIGTQPLQPGEPSGAGSQQATPQPQPPTPQIDTSLMNLQQEYRLQPETSADRTAEGTGTGTASPGTGSTFVPATFASIMNAFPSGPPMAGSGAPTTA